jgi:NAD(P)-dependent dehydrogenase (short-subunit alcohol dehydrogenase family)
MIKTVLITGAARRLGRVMALDFAAMGWRVVVHYHHSRADAEATAAAIVAAGGEAVLAQADLGDEAAVLGLAAQAAAAGDWRCLINNAAIFERDNLVDGDRAGWDRHHAINLRAPMVLCQQFARRLQPGDDALIVNMLDTRVWNLTPYFTSYTASKAALWAMTRTMALELAPAIRVNAIGPGPTLAAQNQSMDHFDGQIAALPLKRAPDLDEFCAAMRFFLAARSVTGQMIALDGGNHLGWVNEGRLGRSH